MQENTTQSGCDNCWCIYQGYTCSHITTWWPMSDLTDAKHECACDLSCVGVFYNSGTPSFTSQSGKYYKCSGSLSQSSPAIPQQQVYKKGQNIQCAWPVQTCEGALR
jgi:hypothetical protein